MKHPLKSPLALLSVLLFGACSLSLDFGEECQHDQDCSSKAWNLHCEEQLCVAASGAEELLKGHCHRLYPPDFDLEQGYLLGSILPVSGDLDKVGPPMENAIYLAIDEINQAGGINSRPLGILSCDSGTDGEIAVEVARQLINEAHVPAIIGPATSGNSIRAFNEVFKEAGVLLITPSATSPSLTALPDDGLLWRTVPPDTFQGAAISAHLQHLKIQKLAVVNRDDAYGNGLRAAIEASYCQEERCSEERYISRSYSVEQEAARRNEQSEIFAEVQGFTPEVVVLIGLLQDGKDFMEMAHEKLQRFIVPDGLKDNTLLEIEDEQMLDRLFGTSPASPEGQIYQRFERLFRSRYGEEPSVFTAQTYDACYLLAYALGALSPEQPPQGALITEKLKLLVGGQRFEVGFIDFNAVIQTLKQGKQLNIEGASGSLDFDPELGEAPGDIEAWYINREKGSIESYGILYNSAGEYTPPKIEGAPDAGIEGAPDAGTD